MAELDAEREALMRQEVDEAMEGFDFNPSPDSGLDIESLSGEGLNIQDYGTTLRERQTRDYLNTSNKALEETRSGSQSTGLEWPDRNYDKGYDLDGLGEKKPGIIEPIED